MAITPEIEDSRFLRFPKDWFNLPWRERNKKFNELINNELERAKEYLDGLSRINEEFYTKSEIKSNVEQSPKSAPIEDSQVVEEVEKVEAGELIEELDRIIQKTETKKNENFKAQETKKKTKDDKNQKKDENEGRGSEPKLVKTLEEHLRDFLRSDETKGWESSKPMKRPPARRGARRSEAGDGPRKRAVQGIPEHQKVMLTKRRNALVALSPRPAHSLIPTDLSAAASQSRPPVTHALQHDLSGSGQPRINPQRVRLPRFPVPSTRPPARLPPIPPRLVPMVTLIIDDPEEHARELLARRNLEPPPPPPSSTITRYKSIVTDLTAPVLRSTLSTVSSTTLSRAHHTTSDAATHNMDQTESKTTAQSTNDDAVEAVTPSSRHININSSTPTVSHITPETNVQNTLREDSDIPQSRAFHASSEIITPTTQFVASEKVASNTQQPNLNALNSNMPHTDSKSTVGSTNGGVGEDVGRNTDIYSTPSNIPHPSSEMIGSRARYAASGILISGAHQPHLNSSPSNVYHTNSKVTAHSACGDVLESIIPSARHSSTTTSIRHAPPEVIGQNSQYAASGRIASNAHYPNFNAPTSNMCRTEPKSTVWNTYQGICKGQTPSGLQNNIYSTTPSVRRAFSEVMDTNVPNATSATNIFSAPQYALDAVNQSIVRASVEPNPHVYSVSDSFSSHQSAIHATAPRITRTSLEMKPLSTRYGNIDVSAPGVHHASSDIIHPCVRPCASETVTSTVHQHHSDVAADRAGHRSSETDISSRNSSLGMSAISASRSDVYLPTPSTCHPYSESALYSDRRAYCGINNPNFLHPPAKTSTFGLQIPVPKMSGPPENKSAMEMTSPFACQANTNTFTPTSCKKATEEGITRLTVARSNTMQCNVANTPEDVGKRLSRIGYYQVMRSESRLRP